MSRILLIRHGETEGESSIRFHGATDVTLSDVGRAHMREARRALPDEAIDLVVASPLSRAWEGARIVAPRRPIVLEDGFREIDFGRWEGLTRGGDPGRSIRSLYRGLAARGRTASSTPEGEARAAFKTPGSWTPLPVSSACSRA